MKIFANKKILKKVVIVFLIISVFSITNPKPVSADIGGTLMRPIISLLIGLGDGINAVVQKFFLQQDPTIIVISDGFALGRIIIGVIIGIGVVAATIITGTWIPAIIGAAIVIGMAIPNSNGVVEKTLKVTYQISSNISAEMLDDNELQLPIIQLSPYEIFSNKGDIFSVNVFKAEREQKAKSNTDEPEPFIYTLKDIIRDWYATLRLIAIVGMMSVLVYIGIRILLSSTAESKAKYKQMLFDWLIATALIFVMHYIMVFANLMVDSVTDLIDAIHIETEEKNGSTTLQIDEQGVEGFYIGAKIPDNAKNGDTYVVDPDSEKLVKKAYEVLVKNGNEVTKQFEPYFWTDVNGTQGDENSSKVLFWPTGNFTAQARMAVQRAYKPGGAGDYAYIGFGIIYITLTIYTLVFIWVYLRRLIYMVFLTLIAPLVALTYPIDKVKDGQAQAFNFWFREYLYNLLIQPVHLLIYIILVGSAMKFAASDPIYVIVALGFMVPAEKLIKAMFGFKGQTPGAMPGVAAGALMMHATRKLFGNPPKSSNASNSQNGEGKSDSGDDNDLPVKTNFPKPYGNENLFGNNSGGPNTPPEGAGGNDDSNDEELDEQGSAMWDYLNGNEQNNTPNGSGGSGSESSTSDSGSDSSDDDSSSSEDSNKNNPVGWLGATRRAIINGARGRVKNTLGSGKWWGNTAKKGIRVAGGALLGATGASLGGIATIVSGDPSKAIENMSLGGLAGYKFGSGVAGAMTDTATGAASKAKNAIEQEYYAGNPDAYDEKKMKEYIKKWKENQNNMEILKRQLGNKAANELIKGDGLEKYLKSGFTDVKDIAAGELFAKQHKNMTTDDAIDVLQINKQIAGGKFKDLNPDEQDKWRRALREKFKKQNPNISDAQLKKNVEDAEGYMNAISDIRSKIK